MVSKISGIYAYYDNLKHEIVYVGRDSNIENHSRHKAHYWLSKKDEQIINKVLQNDNTGRYTYVILEKGDFTNDMLNEKEVTWISFFKPKFNFTEGGDGSFGYKHSEEARKKISRAMSGEKNPQFNSCIKIRKRKDKTCKQGFRYRAYPYTPKKQKTLSSINLQKCIEKVEKFINSEENTYGYDSYEVVK